MWIKEIQLEFSSLPEFILRTINHFSVMQKADKKAVEGQTDERKRGLLKWLGAGLSWSHGSCDCEEAVHCVRHATPQRKSLLILF